MAGEMNDSFPPIAVARLRRPRRADPRRDQRLFASIFILVIASLVVQGWTVGSAARLLGFARRG